MALDDKELLQILDMFHKSGWNDMQLQSGQVKLSISKTGRPRPPDRTDTAAPAQAAAPSPQPEASPAPVAAQPADPPTRTTPDSPVNPDWVAVKAPLLGNFYTAPKPGAPPFVEVGQQVAPGDTLAILEVMKLMNHVKAETAGRIAQVVATNGELVEFEQVLFYIDPSA